jgi:heavy metal translocating P-type ATPase
VDAVTPAGCRHCGLPVGRPAARAAPSPYCCFGCELAAEIAAEGRQGGGRRKSALLFCLLLSMTVMMLSMFLFAEDVYGTGGGGAWLRQAYRVAAAVLATPVVVMLGVPLLGGALSRLRAGQPNMDLLIGTGAVAAWALSLVSMVRGHGGVYFDSATSALLLATLGRYLEASARAKAARVVAGSLTIGGELILAEAADGAMALVPPAELGAGMRIRVGVERTVPVDAEVVDHAIDVDLGVLTGAAAPVTLHPGDEVPAGAIPVSGDLDARVLRGASDSTLERLGALARSLRVDPARVQRLADAFGAALVPLVWTLTLGTLTWHGRRSGLEVGLVTALSVVLVACPCTYGVATPLALWLALRTAAQAGVRVRSAAVLEQLARVRVVAFDKTGTLTAPELSVTAVALEPGVSREEALALARALEDGSRHPVGIAVRSLAERECVPAARLAGRENLPARGVAGVDGQGRRLLLGSPALFAEQGMAAELSKGAARAALAREGRLLARFELDEVVRPEAAEAMTALRALGVEPVVLTGDRDGGARRVADELGVAVHSELSPHAKVHVLRALASDDGAVAMVGDGLNDAPALASVGTSFAMPTGTDLARGLAHVILDRPDLSLVPFTLALARRALTVARTNLAIATAYNAIFLALAVSGNLRPVWAGVSMLGSSLLTLASSLRVAPLGGADPGPSGAESVDDDVAVEAT